MGLLIALEYLKYVVSSSRLFSIDLARLENPLYVYSIYPFMARALLLSIVFAVYITFLSLPDVFCSINNRVNPLRNYPLAPLSLLKI